MQIKIVLTYFVIWRITLFVFLAVAISIFPLQLNFLGGGLLNYLKTPQLWSWINFDGEHYLAIAYRGYEPLTYFYFPAFPILTRLVSNFLGSSYTLIALSGLLVTNISFFVGLIGLMKIIKLDYEDKISRLAATLLLLFPTSFYFGSFYTESLFFALVVWIFYFVRRSRFLLAGVLGGLAVLTRIVGLAIIPALIIEGLIQRSDDNQTLLKSIASSLLVIAGFGVYIYYVFLKTGDPFNFVNTVSLFGSQRNSDLILLPQVFYRYIFKIVPNVNYYYFPAAFTVFLELIIASGFFILSIFSFFKLRLSYAVYLLLGFLIPTFSGSFSSLPRYVLVLFPAFLLMGVMIKNISRFAQIIIFAILFMLSFVATSFFVRGYWVS